MVKEGNSEKLMHILNLTKSDQLSYTENTLCKLLCKPKDWVATVDKNNTVYKIDCSNSETLYFGESN